MVWHCIAYIVLMCRKLLAHSAVVWLTINSNLHSLGNQPVKGIRLWFTDDLSLLCTAYREPFLYTVHYNAIQVMHITGRTAGINIPP